MAKEQAATPPDLSADVAKLKKALEAERAQHKQARQELQAATAHLKEQEALGINPNAQQISEHIAVAVKAGVAAETVELQKQIAELQGKLGESSAANEKLSGQLRSRSIAEAVKDAARAEHVLPSALGDVQTIGALELKLAEDGSVVAEDGRAVDQWLSDCKSTRPFWWPVARGTGARGSGDGMMPAGDNPWAEGSFNLTRQGEIVRSNPAKAATLQAQAAAMKH